MLRWWAQGWQRGMLANVFFKLFRSVYKLWKSYLLVDAYAELTRWHPPLPRFLTRALQPVLPVFFSVQFNFLYSGWANERLALEPFRPLRARPRKFAKSCQNSAKRRQSCCFSLWLAGDGPRLKIKSTVELLPYFILLHLALLGCIDAYQWK